MQRRHHAIIDSNPKNPTIQRVSLAALLKLNVTLSTYFDIVPHLSWAQTTSNISNTDTDMDKVEGCTCRLNGGDAIRHNKWHYCLYAWCPKAINGQDWCPNPQCSNGIKGCKFQPYDENYNWIKCRCGMWLKTREILDAHLAAYQHSDTTPVS